MVFGAVSLASLFLFRECRWVFFDEYPALSNLLIYAFYIPIFVVTVCVLGASLCIDRPEEMKSDRCIRPFWAAGAVLSVIVLTNDYHHLFMRINASGKIDHRFFYYLIIIYEVILVSVSFFITMRRCSLSVVKRRWFIPVSVVGIGVFLLVVYFFEGGSPMIGRVKLFHIQEVYAFLFIGFLEACIQIGLIPANKGYSFFFEKTDVEAWIEDGDHTLVYETEKNREKKLSSEGRRVQEKEMPVSGGSVHWTSDLTHIYELRDEIRAAIDRLSEENTLIRYENEIKSRNAEIRARKALYEKIAKVTAPMAEELKEYIDLAERDKENQRRWIAEGAVICACIKRRANLELLGFEKREISEEELSVSVKEVSDCLGKCSYQVYFPPTGKKEVPAAILQHWFSAYCEDVMETLRKGRCDPNDL